MDADDSAPLHLDHPQPPSIAHLDDAHGIAAVARQPAEVLPADNDIPVHDQETVVQHTPHHADGIRRALLFPLLAVGDVYPPPFPLAEIAADVIHPELQKTILELANTSELNSKNLKQVDL